MAHKQPCAPETTEYVWLIRRLNVTIPDDLDPVLRAAAGGEMSEADFIRRAIRETALHDKYAALERTVTAQGQDILDIQRHLGLTSGTARHTTP